MSAMDQIVVNSTDFTFMISQRGRRLVVKDDFKYHKSGYTKTGVRYACTKKICRAFLFLDVEETIIHAMSGAHVHPPHASIPLKNGGKTPRKERKDEPIVMKVLPKRKVVPPKRISYPMPGEEEVKPKIKKQPDNLKQEMSNAINQACTELSSDNGIFGKFTVNVDAKKMMTDFIWKKLETFVEDVEAFANHANRPDITEDDVKLLFRRNEALSERFAELDVEMLQNPEEFAEDST